MNHKQVKPNKKLDDAYKMVIADLKKSIRCKDEDYAIGCYECGLRFLYKNLKSHYELLDDL